MTIYINNRGFSISMIDSGQHSCLDERNQVVLVFGTAGKPKRKAKKENLLTKKDSAWTKWQI